MNIFFESFFFTKDRQEHYTFEIQEEYENNNGDISKFRGALRCPECREAELAFTHKTSTRREYLSKIPSSNHLDGCSYIYDYANKTELGAFIKGLDGKKLRDRLEATLNMLSSLSAEKNPCKSIIKGNNPFVININSKNTVVSRSIPRKSLNLYLDKDLENRTFIFYGKVKLYVEKFEAKKDKEEYYRLKIYTKKKDGSWVYKSEVFRGKQEDIIQEDRVYEIAMFGHLDFTHSKSPQIKLESKDALLYR